MVTVALFDFVIVNVTLAPANGEPPAVTVAVTLAVWLREYDEAPGEAMTESPDATTYDAAAEPEYAPFDAFAAKL